MKHLALAWSAAAVAATALAGCATIVPTPESQPEVNIYHPPPDLRYRIPERFRTPQPGERERRARFQQEASQVHQRVMHDPAFGGFILRWLPEPHALVMFTGDAEARLRRYTSDPRFRAWRVDLTLAQLERMKDQFGDELARLGLKCFSVDGDEERNSVTVGAPPEELEKLHSAIAAGRVKPPPKLHLKAHGCPTFR